MEIRKEDIDSRIHDILLGFAMKPKSVFEVSEVSDATDEIMKAIWPVIDYLHVNGSKQKTAYVNVNGAFSDDKDLSDY